LKKEPGGEIREKSGAHGEREGASGTVRIRECRGQTSIGIEDPLDSPETRRAYAIAHWATGHDNATQDLSRFVTFLRSNLIAAGLI
jgi:hypothetical protein